MWKPTPHPAPWHRAQMLAWREVPSPRWPQFPHLHPGLEERTLHWTAGGTSGAPHVQGSALACLGQDRRTTCPRAAAVKPPSVYLHTRYRNSNTHNSQGASHPGVHGHVDGQTVGSSRDGILVSFERRKLTQATTCTSPDDALLSETGQSQKHKYHRAPLT